MLTTAESRAKVWSVRVISTSHHSGSNVVVSSVFVVATTYDMVTSFLQFNDVIDRRAVGVGLFFFFIFPMAWYGVCDRIF